MLFINVLLRNHNLLKHWEFSSTALPKFISNFALYIFNAYNLLYKNSILKVVIKINSKHVFFISLKHPCVRLTYYKCQLNITNKSK